jgi:hypothetical protein
MMDNAKEVARANAFIERIAERSLAMEGTCTGEHGIGQGKKRFLEAEHGRATVEAMRAIKHALDPDGIGRSRRGPDHPRLSKTALHLSYTLTEPLLGQSPTSAGSRSVSLASQPYCRVSLSTSCRSRRPHGSQTTDRTGTRTSDRVCARSRGMMAERVHENEAGTQGPDAPLHALTCP